MPSDPTASNGKGPGKEGNRDQVRPPGKLARGQGRTQSSNREIRQDLYEAKGHSEGLGHKVEGSRNRENLM